MITYILVHGAWHGGWCYKHIAKQLRAKGHEVYTPTNTGLGERSHLYHRNIDLNTHITDVINVIKWEELDDFVLVGHSYGGMIITGVADRFPEKIRRLVYLDAFVPEDGRCEMDYLPEELKSAMRSDAEQFNNGTRPIPAVDFHVNEKQVSWVNSMCVPHPIHTFDQILKLRGGIDKIPNKRVFIHGEKFIEGPFEQFYKRLASDENWITYKLPCGHEIMIDMPDELVRILLEIGE